MFVQTIPEKKSGRTLICYYVGRRVDGKNKQFLVKRLGYLDEFTDKYPDPLAHFKEEAKRLTLEEKAQKMTLEYSLADYFDFAKSFSGKTPSSLESTDLVRYYGVLPLLKIYRELKLDYFLDIKRQYHKTQYNHNHIFQLLVFGRILCPDSKLETWRNRNKILNLADFSDDDMYRSFDFFSSIKDDMLDHLNRQMCDRHGRRTTLMYYDVTNYYWEIDKEDNLRKRGYSKERRPEPIVQMGLFMDSNAMPVSYGLFPGNNNDVITMRPMMETITKKLGNRHIIYVADKGMISGMNVARIIMDNNGYVISSPVRKAKEELQNYVREQQSYTVTDNGEFKFKSRIVPRRIKVQTYDGKIREVKINERQIVFWSRKYADKSRHDREKAIEKALSRAGNGENTVLNNHAGNRFIEKIIMDSEDGKVIEKPEFSYQLDEDLKNAEDALDGYYLIRSNVFGLLDPDKPFADNPDAVRWHRSDGLLELNRAVSDLDLVDMYRGLWQIEESFKITKSILKARPAYVHLESSIQAHFLSCFVSLLMLRILEKKTEGKIPLQTMVESLRKAQISLMADGNYQNNYCDNIIADISNVMELDLTKKYFTPNDLKRLRGQTRKRG